MGFNHFAEHFGNARSSGYIRSALQHQSIITSYYYLNKLQWYTIPIDEESGIRQAFDIGGWEHVSETITV